MIWFILAIAFAVLAIYLHKSADKLDNPHNNHSHNNVVESKTLSYWEKYKTENPAKASSIETQLKINFARMADNDVKETIFSLERMATTLKCNISDIKERYLDEISKYPIELLPEMIASASREMDNEAKIYGISTKNTMSSIMIRWLKERSDDMGNTDTTVSQNASNNDIDIVKKLCPYITNDIDVMERLKSLREMSLLWKCPIGNLKDFYISDMKQSYDGTYEHFHYLPETLKHLAGKSLEVANHSGVKPDNTAYSILFEWLNEFIKEERSRLIEKGEVVCPRCSGKNIKLGVFKDEFVCNSCGTRFGNL